MRRLLPLGMLLAGVAAAAPPEGSPPQRPFSPLQPFGEPDPVTADDVDAVLDRLTTDVATWSALISEGTRRLGRSAGPEPSDLDRVLQVLAARVRLARESLQAMGAPLSPGQDHQRVLAESRADASLRAGLEPLVALRLGRIDAALRDQDSGAAMAHARALVQTLDAVAPVLPSDADLDGARVVLLNLALAVGQPQRARTWAATCLRLCRTPVALEAASKAQAAAARRQPGQNGESVDPLQDLGAGSPEVLPGNGPTPSPVGEPQDTAHLRFRVGLGLALPLGEGVFEGAEVNRGLSGTLDVAWAPLPGACVTARLARDMWRAPDHPEALQIARQRAELGFCPRLVAWPLGKDGAVGVRAVLGLGVAWGHDQQETVGQGRLVGWGPHVRLEVPVVLGPVELSLGVGAAPYGRARAWSLSPDRAPYRFMERTTATLGVQVGLP